MKTENNINAFLNKNTIAVGAAIAILITVVIYSVITNNAIISQKNHNYIMTEEGDFISLKQVEKREVLEIHILNHLAMFVEFYYNLSQNDWERKINKALWLGDLELDFQNKNNMGYYSNIVQWGIERKTELKKENVELEFKKEGVIFKIILPLVERYNDKRTGLISEKQYMYFMQGTIREVQPNFPYNPHGLYIENFREDKRIEVTE